MSLDVNQNNANCCASKPRGPVDISSIYQHQQVDLRHWSWEVFLPTSPEMFGSDLMAMSIFR